MKETLPLITSRCGILFDEVPKKMNRYHKPTPVSSDFTFSNKAIKLTSKFAAISNDRVMVRGPEDELATFSSSPFDPFL